MKKIATIALLLFFGGITAQTTQYDSILKRTNYFNVSNRFVGYEKNYKYYDKDGNQIGATAFGQLYNSNDSPPKFDIELKKIQVPESQVPGYTPQLRSATWNALFNRWDYWYY